jgi:hypothetical protein
VALLSQIPIVTLLIRHTRSLLVNQDYKFKKITPRYLLKHILHPTLLPHLRSKPSGRENGGFRETTAGGPGEPRASRWVTPNKSDFTTGRGGSWATTSNPATPPTQQTISSDGEIKWCGCWGESSMPSWNRIQGGCDNCNSPRLPIGEIIKPATGRTACNLALKR